ncbi:MAG: hypothetical protein ACYCWE_05390 [Eubacteriales bacterium]
MYVRNSGDRRPPPEQPRERIQRPVHISSPRSRNLIPPPDYGGTILYDTGSETETILKRETDNREGISFNPRNDLHASGRKVSIPSADGDNAALFASGKLPFEEQILNAGLDSDSEDMKDTDEESHSEILQPILLNNDKDEDDNRTEPRRPLVSRSEYEESYGNRTSQDHPLIPDTQTGDERSSPVKIQDEQPRPAIARRNRRLYRSSGVAKRAEAQKETQSDISLLPGILPPISDEMLLIALIVLLMMSGSDDEMIIILAFLLLMR